MKLKYQVVCIGKDKLGGIHISTIFTAVDYELLSHNGIEKWTEIASRKLGRKVLVLNIIPLKY